SSTDISEEKTGSTTGGATTNVSSSERQRISVQFGERDYKRASRLLHSALPKPTSAAAISTSKPPQESKPVDTRSANNESKDVSDIKDDSNNEKDKENNSKTLKGSDDIS